MSWFVQTDRSVACSVHCTLYSELRKMKQQPLRCNLMTLSFFFKRMLGVFVRAGSFYESLQILPQLFPGWCYPLLPRWREVFNFDWFLFLLCRHQIIGDLKNPNIKIWVAIRNIQKLSTSFAKFQNLYKSAGYLQQREDPQLSAIDVKSRQQVQKLENTRTDIVYVSYTILCVHLTVSQNSNFGISHCPKWILGPWANRN